MYMRVCIKKTNGDFLPFQVGDNGVEEIIADDLGINIKRPKRLKLILWNLIDEVEFFEEIPERSK